MQAMGRSATEQKRDKRDCERLSTKEKEALVLSRTIVTALYHNDDAPLKRTMARTGIDGDRI